MTGIKIPVSADFDGADIEKTIAKLNEQMNRLAQTVATANKMKFTPVTQGSVNELKQVEDRFKELLKISGALRDRVKATGQGGLGFGAVDWNRLYDDPTIRQRKLLQAFQHVTAGTSYGLQAVPTAPAPSGTKPGAQPAAPSNPAAPPAPAGPGLGSTLGGIAGAGLRATGPVGGVVANAASAGMSGGFSAGLLGLFGGLAALGIGKGIGAIKDKVDAAGQEGVGYDTLKRTLGDVNVSFSLLRESLRAASYDIDTTFEQTQKLGTDFAKLSGMTREQYKTLAEEVSVGGGFGRSFGMDPEQSNAFFAQMRQFQVTANVNESKRLALMIGEAVGKTGQFGKMDEVLQAISGFAASQTRNSLASANVQGYAGQLAGFMASRVPGLDAQGSAAILGRVNGAIMGGGAIGEAGQNYLFSALGRRLGLNPVQVALLQQQGAFGTGRMAFGAGSLFSQFSKKFGGGVSGAAATSDDTNLSTILSKIQRDYGNNPSLMLNATARLLGVNENQAMALHTIGPQSLGGMTDRMGRLGLDLGQLSATGISALSNIETGDRGALLSQADALRKSRKALSVDENKRLQAAIDGGDTEKLRDILTELTYSREQEQTDGSKTRESINQVDKTIQEMASKLVPLMTDMRYGIVHMAGHGKLGAIGIQEAVMRTEAQERIGNHAAKNSADIEEQRSLVRSIGEEGGPGELGKLREDYRKKILEAGTPEGADAFRKEYVQKRDELLAKKRAAQMRILELVKESSDFEEKEKARLEEDVKQLKINAATAGTSSTPPADPNASSLKDPQNVMHELARTDRELGLSPGTSAAQISKESRFNPSAYNKKSGAMGLAQVMPKTLAAIEQRLGRKLDPYNENDAVIIHREVMRENKDRFKTDAAALAAYNGGWDSSKWGNPETTDYVATITQNRGHFASPMPEGARTAPAQQQTQNINLSGEFTMVNGAGQRIADPLQIKKRVMLPVASGG
jgi:hypothetical protein